MTTIGGCRSIFLFLSLALGLKPPTWWGVPKILFTYRRCKSLFASSVDVLGGISKALEVTVSDKAFWIEPWWKVNGAQMRIRNETGPRKTYFFFRSGFIIRRFQIQWALFVFFVRKTLIWNWPIARTYIGGFWMIFNRRFCFNYSRLAMPMPKDPRTPKSLAIQTLR